MIRTLLVLIAVFTSVTSVAQGTEAFFCKEGNKAVRLEFEGNINSLELDKPTKLKIYVENIDLKMSAISGMGIRPLGNGRPDEFFLCEVTVDKESVIGGHYQVIFSYKPLEGGDRGVCRFLIPVKNE